MGGGGGGKQAKGWYFGGQRICLCSVARLRINWAIVSLQVLAAGVIIKEVKSDCFINEFAEKS